MSDNEEFNKRCAEALKWYITRSANAEDAWMKGGSSLNCHYDFIDNPYTKLKFHSSYDWAMLLVKECLKEYQDPVIFMTVTSGHNSYSGFCNFCKSPQRISEIALELLEAAK